jgi:hypothetical protein
MVKRLDTAHYCKWQHLANSADAHICPSLALAPR